MEKKRDTRRKPIDRRKATGRKIKKAAAPQRARQEAPPGETAILSARLMTEQINRALSRAIGQQQFESIDDLNAFLARFTDRPMEEILAELPDGGPGEKAQELAYQAMEEPDSDRAFELARQALAIDPDCLDAAMLVAANEAESLEELVQRIRAIIERAEGVMGEDYLNESRGHFWSIAETRPYMRALSFQADRLKDLAWIDEEIETYEKMLDLNPNDNQGVRDPLLGLYLETGRLDDARRLLEFYADADSAVFLWGRVLERFLSGDLKGAATALRKAHHQNRHVFDYMTGRKRPSRTEVEYYSPGQPSEALVCLDVLITAWIAHREALAWLRAQDPKK